MNDITDPSDWPSDYASLKDIDSHLRCPICKEILRAALMLQCHHNFCSECIRRHLDKESTCPACRVATSTAQMRRNVALDEIANSFKDCRALLLQTVRNAVEIKNTKSRPLLRADSMDADDFSSRQQKRRRTSTRITRATSNLSSQEHSYGMSQDDDDKDGDFVMPSQESTSAYKGKNVTHYSSGPTLEPRSGREVTPNNIQESSTSQQTLAAVPPTPSSTSSTPSAPSTPTKTNHTLVPCPVCQMSVPEAYANTHLDKYCFVGKEDPAYTLPHSLMISQDADIIALYERQGTSKQAVVGSSPKSSPQRNGTINVFDNSRSQNGMSQQSRMPQSPTRNIALKQAYPEPKRIPKLTYSVLNDKQLRKKLQELGLPSHGDKQLMQKRHAEYVTIYNANCDSTRPQTTAQLMKAMDAWERSYEMDMQAKEAQRRAQEKQQRLHQEHQKQMAQHAAAAAAAVAVTNSSDVSSSPSSTPSSSQSNIPTGSSSSGFVSNQTNNNETAVAIASASAFAHALKYADEYAELIADVKRRQAADKEKTLVDKNEAAVNDPQQGTTSSQL